MAVAFDAKMTGGNGVGGTYAELNQAASPFSSTGMTVGASATCLVVVLAFNNNIVSGLSVTWNGVAMTAGPTITDGTATIQVAIFYLANPATGNKTLTANFTGTSAAYMSAISFSGTDTVNPIKTADSVTAQGVNSITITSDTNGATLAVEADDGTVAPPTTNFTLIYNASDLAENSTATYNIGGTSNTHNFTGANSIRTLAGIHIVAPSSSSVAFEDDSFKQFQPPAFDAIVSVW